MMSDSLQSVSARWLSLCLEVGKMNDVECFGFRVELICPKTTWLFKDSEKQQKKQRLNCQHLFRCLVWKKLRKLMIILKSIHCRQIVINNKIGLWLTCIHRLCQFLTMWRTLFAMDSYSFVTVYSFFLIYFHWSNYFGLVLFIYRRTSICPT